VHVGGSTPSRGDATVAEDGMQLDAIVIGAGPNGLSAAVALARAGRSVRVLEASERIGGGTRTEELTRPGFRHDVCSAIHPLAVASPFFRSLPLERFGVEWVHPPLPLTHPLDDGDVAILERSAQATARLLGRDAAAYTDLIGPLVRGAEALLTDLLRPLRVPSHPVLLARFGMRALRSCRGLADAWFTERRTRALFAGCGAHSTVPLERPGTASFALVLLLAGHAFGWPCARGGSRSIADALASVLHDAGGEIVLSTRVGSLRELPSCRAILLDLTPRQVVEIAGDDLPPSYRDRLLGFGYGPGVFKIDWALREAIPWRNPECRQSATVHVGDTLEAIAAAEADVWAGRPPDRPFVLVAQPSVFDPTRAPQGRHTGWAYCHVPNGSNVDMTVRVERQIERFAPGFRDCILARHTIAASEYASRNPNLVGGDNNGGANTLSQILARPVLRYDPYATPNPRIFLCSSSTPPGGGVHGMCGYGAARSALRGVLR
jgi:phytoene dehydrogenase-like protein